MPVMFTGKPALWTLAN